MIRHRPGNHPGFTILSTSLLYIEQGSINKQAPNHLKRFTPTVPYNNCHTSYKMWYFKNKLKYKSGILFVVFFPSLFLARKFKDLFVLVFTLEVLCNILYYYCLNNERRSIKLLCNRTLCSWQYDITTVVCGNAALSSRILIILLFYPLFCQTYTQIGRKTLVREFMMSYSTKPTNFRFSFALVLGLRRRPYVPH